MKKAFLSILCMAASSFATCFSADLLDISKQPTIGNPNAKVQVVAFLEPKCPDSKKYSNDSFPLLKKEFIDTDKVSYTIITASFLSQSMPAAVALLCIYNPDSDKPNTQLFFNYLDYIYHHQPAERKNWATTETLLDFAKNVSPSIDQNHLKNCIESNQYQTQIEKNTAYGNRLMGRISTPTLYVNGIKVENKDDTVYYKNLKTAIENALSQ